MRLVSVTFEWEDGGKLTQSRKEFQAVINSVVASAINTEKSLEEIFKETFEGKE